ncbi:hypothetical protein KCG48_10430 [Proteiniclasticum sp. BAD-10]|uniref:Phage tail tape measure protein n=1 Tax=Proteiniclasticum sediminis TaxID=2804028 RepID=A0A941HRM0_9CLOT|nr:hypothetical protein [Proteiniclasticum sediminis]MBR0576748.1 hypothetical protein [Proteiniclasticum sediminis]
MGKDIRGITIQLEGETTGLAKSLQDVNKKARDLQQELKEVEQGLKLDPKNTELLAQKQKLLGDAVENTKEKLERLKSAQEQVTEQFNRGEISEQQYRDFQREVVNTESKLKSLENQLSNVNNKWKYSAKALGEFGKKTEELGNKMAPISKTAGAALTGIVGIGIKAASTADDLNTLSKQTGLSVEELQKFQMASDTIDVPMDTMTGSLSKLTKNMAGAKDGTGPAAEAFAQLGVKITDSNGALLDNEDVFYSTIDALGKVANETERDAMAMQIFGKSAQDLNPLILGGADALREMGKAAEEKGLILSQEEIDKANALQDTLDSIKAESMQGLMQIGADLAPILIPMFEAIGNAISGVINWFKNLDEGTKKTIMIVLGIIAAVAPVLIIIGKIATGISALMSVLSAIGPVIAVLTGPIGLVIAAVAAVIAIGVLLYKNWDKIKQFAAQLWENLKNTFSGIRDSVVNAFSGVLNGIKNIWTNVTSFLAGLPGKMLEFGKDIINGLVNGIKAKITAVTDAVKNIANSITGKIKSILGIHSPAQELIYLGEDTGEGFAVGIENMAKRAASAASGMAQGVAGAAKPQGTASTITAGGTLNINITGEGSSALKSDARFLQQVKTAIINQISSENKSIPNRAGLIPIG